jgi:hypothetical protein
VNRTCIFPTQQPRQHPAHLRYATRRASCGGTPFRLNLAAIARNDVTPASRSSAMMDASSDARASARAVRALRPAPKDRSRRRMALEVSG